MKNKKACIQGHVFNHQTGCIDSINKEGVATPLAQVAEPSEATKHMFIVGSLSKLELNYHDSEPSEWVKGKTWGWQDDVLVIK